MMCITARPIEDRPGMVARTYILISLLSIKLYTSYIHQVSIYTIPTPLYLSCNELTIL